MNEKDGINEIKNILLDQIRLLNSRSRDEGTSESHVAKMSLAISELSAEFRYLLEAESSHS